MRIARRLVAFTAILCLGLASQAPASDQGLPARQETSGVNTGGRGYVTSADNGSAPNLRATCRYESRVDPLGLSLQVRVEGTAVASELSMIHSTEITCSVKNADGTFSGGSDMVSETTASVSFDATMTRKAITVCAAAAGQAPVLTHTVHEACWQPTSVRITAYGHITIEDLGDGHGPRFTYTHCLAPGGECLTAPELQNSFVCSESTAPTVTARCVPNTPPDYVWACTSMDLTAASMAGATSSGGRVKAHVSCNDDAPPILETAYTTWQSSDSHPTADVRESRTLGDVKAIVCSAYGINSTTLPTPPYKVDCFDPGFEYPFGPGIRGRNW